MRRLTRALALALAACSGGGATTSVAPGAPPFVPVLSKVAVMVQPYQFEMLKQSAAIATAFDQNGGEFPSATFTFASSDVAVATVDAAGMVRGVGPGQSTITATAGGKSASQVIFVTLINPARVDLLPGADTTLAVGATMTLRATPYDGDGRLVPGWAPVWSSSDTTVALVSSAGEVRARSPGKAKITVTIGLRSAALVVTVPGTPTPGVTSDIILTVASPTPGYVASDSLHVWVGAKTEGTIASAVAVVAADTVVMRPEPAGALGNGILWHARLDLTLLHYGPYWAIVRFRDGHGVFVTDSVPFTRNPNEKDGGSAAPRGGNKLRVPPP